MATASLNTPDALGGPVNLATVPMDPMFLPESVLLFSGVIGILAALYLLLTRRPSLAWRAGSVGLAFFALSFVMSKTLHKPPAPPALVAASANSMSLVLGDVVLRVAPSDRYVLSVDGKQFLVLDLRRSQLRVSGVMGAHDRVLTGLAENTFPFSRTSSIRPARDAHTLVVKEEDEEVFKVRYAEPGRIEVTGQFFETGSARSALISCEDGISWMGGTIPRGSTIDLRDQGVGTVDFGRSGVIRVLPRN